MATAVALMLGILGITLTVQASSRQNRRNNNLNQATLIAEQELERIVALHCDNQQIADPCLNIKALDNTARQVWWSANGRMMETAPGAGDPPQVAYTLAVDVDPPFEAGETGAPALNRTIVTHGAAIPANVVVNVRVTVSWVEPNSPRRAVALQTRMSP